MKKEINHEGFIADLNEHIEAISSLVSLYGYEGYVCMGFKDDGYISVTSYEDNLSYFRLPGFDPKLDTQAFKTEVA